jgi:acetolactate synthase I/III small subunit
MPTFVIYARKTPEVLARIVLLFHRRAIEIERLTAGHAGRPGVLLIEATLACADDGARLIEANLHKLVDVLLVERRHSTTDGMNDRVEDGNPR